MSQLHPTIRHVRGRIERRSERSRADYLDALPAKPADRKLGIARLSDRPFRFSAQRGV